MNIREKVRKPLGIMVIVAALFVAWYMIYWEVIHAQTGYSYQSEITVENTNASAYYGRVLAEVNARALMLGGYIQQADAQDVLVTQNGTEENVTALGLTEVDPLWIYDYTSIPANTSITKLMYIGNATATRSQIWIGSSEDTCYANYDASLDFPGTSTFELSCNITPKIMPATGEEDYIIARPGVYELIVNGTPSYIFRVFENNGSSGSESMAPDASISNSCDVVGTIPALFSDSNDATYIYEEHEETCVVGIADTGLPLGLNVGTVTVQIRARDPDAPNTSWVQPDIRYVGGSYSAGSKIYPGNTYAWHEEVFTTDPEGNPWSIDRFGDIQLRLTLNGQAFAYVSEANIKIEGTYPGSATSVSINATLDNEVRVAGYYINGHIGIYDGTQTTTGTASTNLHTNTSNIHVCEYDGYAEYPRITTP